MQKKTGLFTSLRFPFAIAVIFAFSFVVESCSSSPSGNAATDKGIQNGDLPKSGEVVATDSGIPPKSIDTATLYGMVGDGLSNSANRTKKTDSPTNIVPKSSNAKVTAKGNKIPTNPGNENILIESTKKEVSPKPLDVVIPPNPKGEVSPKSVDDTIPPNPKIEVEPKSVEVETIANPKDEGPTKTVEADTTTKPKKEDSPKTTVSVKTGDSKTNIPNQPGGWVAPESANKLVNPLKGNPSATAAGKKLFGQLCAICHGKKGKGDGVAGMSLKPRPSNFTQDVVQLQTDGAIFWKLSEGKPPMAPYKSTLTEEQRWQLVNYIRSFKKN